MSGDNSNTGRSIVDKPDSPCAPRKNAVGNNSPRPLKSIKDLDDGIKVLWSSSDGDRFHRSSSESPRSLRRAKNVDVDSIRVLWNSEDDSRSLMNNKKRAASVPIYESKRRSTTLPASSKPKIVKKE